MSEWKEYTIGDVCSRLSSGKSINASHIKETDKYPVYGGNGLRGFTDNYNFDGECAIIGRQGASCGNVRYFSGKAYMTEHAVVAVPTDEHNAYYLSCVLASLKLGRLSGQSAQPGIGVGLIGKQTITLPSLATQNRIASILSSLDDKIAINRRICENLEAQAQALFKHWFIDFAPFKDGKFVESELGMIPEGWRVGTLGELCIQITDGVHNTVLNDNNSSYLLLSAKNIKSGVINISDNERHISKYTFDILRKRTKLSKSDILLTSVGTLGELCYLNEESNNFEFQRSVAILKADSIKTHGLWLFHCLKSQIRKIIHLGHGAVQQCIFIGDLRDYQVVIPPKKSIDSFVESICPNQDLLTKLQNESFRLSTLRDTLLPKLMSGQIKL